MAFATNIKATNSCVFSEDGGRFFVTLRGRVKRFDLIMRPNGPPRVRQIWATSVSNPSWISMACGGSIIVVKDHWGSIYGLSSDEGRIIWHTKHVGCGNACIDLDDGTFIDVSHDGVVNRLFAESGQPAAPPHQLPVRVFGLQVAGDRYFFANPILPGRPDLPIQDDFCELHPKTMTATTLLSECETKDFSMRQTGDLVIFHSADAPPGVADRDRRHRLSVVDVGSGQPLASRSLGRKDYARILPATWAPVGELIGCPVTGGNLFLRASDLSAVALVPSPYPYTILFSPDGETICIGDQQETKLIRTVDLPHWALAD